MVAAAAAAVAAAAAAPLLTHSDGDLWWPDKPKVNHEITTGMRAHTWVCIRTARVHTHPHPHKHTQTPCRPIKLKSRTQGFTF